MVRVFCAIVGDGTAFSVRVEKAEWEDEDGYLVEDLKEVVKAQSRGTITVASSRLRLFLAKKGERWLTNSDTPAVKLDTDRQPVAVEEDGSTHPFVKMDETVDVLFYFGKDFERKSGEVHVLVVVPEGDSGAEATGKRKLTSLAMLLKNSKVVGKLPQEGEFLNLFEWTDGDCGTVVDITVIDAIVDFTGSEFYVRKEILCVLEIFKSVYWDEFDTGKVGKMQFVLMGSPGTGKSCILALLCVYIAVRCKRPVIWFRRVNGGLNLTATRLFYQGKY
jgi:hypothetical protein